MFTEEERKAMEPLSCVASYSQCGATVPIEPKRRYCYKYYRDMVCSRKCNYCNRTYSMKYEREHDEKVQAIVDSKAKTSFIRAPAGGGFSVQVLHDRAAHAHGFTAVATVRVAQLPAAGRLGCVATLMPPTVLPDDVVEHLRSTTGVGGADLAQWEPMTFFVDAAGNVGLRQNAVAGGGAIDNGDGDGGDASNALVPSDGVVVANSCAGSLSTSRQQARRLTTPAPLGCWCASTSWNATRLLPLPLPGLVRRRRRRRRRLLLLLLLFRLPCR